MLVENIIQDLQCHSIHPVLFCEKYKTKMQVQEYPWKQKQLTSQVDDLASELENVLQLDKRGRSDKNKENMSDGGDQERLNNENGNGYRCENSEGLLPAAKYPLKMHS